MSKELKERKISQLFFWENFFPSKHNPDSLRETLKKNFLFEDLTKSELRYLERIVHLRSYDAGEFVFHQDERALGMYIIVSGKVTVLVHSRDSSGLKAKDTLITTLGEGAFLGEHSLIEADSRRTASTVAAEPTVLIAFLKPDLIDIVQRRPIMGLKITLQLAKVLSTRLRKTTERLSELSHESEQQND
jgi:CRP/FNR family cyclic AMP-dependent transcriptional regulator